MFLMVNFLNFRVWPPKSSILDRKFGIYVKNPPYSRLESSQKRNFGPYMTKFMFYAHIEIVVAFLVVKHFGFWVTTRSPLPWIWMKIGGNASYRPPGPF